MGTQKQGKWLTQARQPGRTDGRHRFVMLLFHQQKNPCSHEQINTSECRTATWLQRLSGTWSFQICFLHRLFYWANWPGRRAGYQPACSACYKNRNASCCGSKYLSKYLSLQKMFLTTFILRKQMIWLNQSSTNSPPEGAILPVCCFTLRAPSHCSPGPAVSPFSRCSQQKLTLPGSRACTGAARESEHLITEGSEMLVFLLTPSGKLIRLEWMLYAQHIFILQTSSFIHQRE